MLEPAPEDLGRAGTGQRGRGEKGLSPGSYECLPSQETVYTYLRDGESRLVCEEPCHELPQEGKVR